MNDKEDIQEALKWLMMTDAAEQKKVKVPVADVVTNPESVHKNKWVKMGNVAMQPNKFLHQVALEVTNDSREMYGDEAAWKQMIKDRIAEKLAKEIVNDIKFTHTSNDLNGTTQVFGRVYIVPVDDMNRVFDSTTYNKP